MTKTSNKLATQVSISRDVHRKKVENWKLEAKHVID
jgi:hypothetical protein